MDNRDFDKWAEHYDESMVARTDEFPFVGYFVLLAAVQRDAQPCLGLDILDIGIGTGALSGPLAEAGGRIYGVDFSTGMIKRAAARIPNGKFDTVDIAHGHFGRFSNTRFDRVVSSYWLHHLDENDKVEMLKRIRANNLKDGGRIIIGDVGFESLQSFESARARYDNLWDSDEHYLCGERLVSSLKENALNFSYRQISPCAGLLTSQ